jgi:hypothetical protein
MFRVCLALAHVVLHTLTDVGDCSVYAVAARVKSKTFPLGELGGAALEGSSTAQSHHQALLGWQNQC